MATLMVSGLSPRLRAMAGRAVAITVESRFSMNKAKATIRGKMIGGRSEGLWIVSRVSDMNHMKIGRADVSGEAFARNSVLQSAQDIEASPVGSKGWSRKGCRLVNVPGEAFDPRPPSSPSPPEGGRGPG